MRRSATGANAFDFRRAAKFSARSFPTALSAHRSSLRHRIRRKRFSVPHFRFCRRLFAHQCLLDQRAPNWNILVRGWPTSYSLWKHFEVALGNPGYSIPALWYAVAVGLIGVFIFRLYRNRTRQSETELVWFALFACAFALAGCYAFLRVLNYTTSDWYYLAFICVVAAPLYLIASSLCATKWLRLLRVALGVATFIAAPFADWSAI